MNFRRHFGEGSITTYIYFCKYCKQLVCFPNKEVLKINSIQRQQKNCRWCNCRERSYSWGLPHAKCHIRHFLISSRFHDKLRFTQVCNMSLDFSKSGCLMLIQEDKLITLVLSCSLKPGLPAFYAGFRSLWRKLDLSLIVLSLNRILTDWLINVLLCWQIVWNSIRLQLIRDIVPHSWIVLTHWMPRKYLTLGIFRAIPLESVA